MNEIRTYKVYHQGSTDFSTDISSVRVVNHTTPLQSRYGGEPTIHRLTLQENHYNQRVLLQVEGNVPEYNLSCKRWCILYYLPPAYREGATIHSVGCTKLSLLKRANTIRATIY